MSAIMKDDYSDTDIMIQTYHSLIIAKMASVKHSDSNTLLTKNCALVLHLARQPGKQVWQTDQQLPCSVNPCRPP